MLIRREESEDYEKIYMLVKDAFESAAVKDGDEQDYVNELRKCSCYIPGLALVAAEEDNIVGHIMLTETEFVSDAGRFKELLLSPLCVAQHRRKRGIGGMLIKEGLRLAEEMGYAAVFLCGDPVYYKKYGFRHASEFGIINTSDPQQEHVLAYELNTGYFRDKKGTINIV